MTVHRSEGEDRIHQLVKEISDDHVETKYEYGYGDVTYSWSAVDEAAIEKGIRELVREAQMDAWDAACEESEAYGWMHEYARAEMKMRNPYRYPPEENQ